MSADISKERQILMAMRKTLAGVVRDLTPTDSAVQYPLSDATVQDVKMCFDLIAARERELAALEGVDNQRKPRFIDDATAPKVIPIDQLRRSTPAKE